MKVTYELSINELSKIIDLILNKVSENEAFERVLKRHFEVKD